jgi:hypothetical protein
VKSGVSDEYIQNSEIASELQEMSDENTKIISQNPTEPNKLFGADKSNNFLFSCYYCDKFGGDDENAYTKHVVLYHPGKPSYPNRADL